MLPEKEPPRIKKAKGGTRTLDRGFTKAVLYQLSYFGAASKGPVILSQFPALSTQKHARMQGKFTPGTSPPPGNSKKKERRLLRRRSGSIAPRRCGA